MSQSDCPQLFLFGAVLHIIKHGESVNHSSRPVEGHTGEAEVGGEACWQG